MAEPIISTLGIVGIKNCGAYDNSTNYEKLNVVTYQGSSYCAKGNTVGNLPTNTTYWDLLAQKGDTGETGDTGPQGPKPVKGVDYYTAEDIADLESTLASAVTSEVSEQLSDLASANPTVVSSTSEMVDTTKIYVSLSDGKWYYHNGTAWTDGGDYVGDVDAFVKKEGIGEVQPKNMLGSEKDTYKISGDIFSTLELVEEGKYAYVSNGNLAWSTNASYNTYLYEVKDYPNLLLFSGATDTVVRFGVAVGADKTTVIGSQYENFYFLEIPENAKYIYLSINVNTYPNPTLKILSYDYKMDDSFKIKENNILNNVTSGKNISNNLMGKATLIERDKYAGTSTSTHKLVWNNQAGWDTYKIPVKKGDVVNTKNIRFSFLVAPDEIYWITQGQTFPETLTVTNDGYYYFTVERTKLPFVTITIERGYNLSSDNFTIKNGFDAFKKVAIVSDNHSASIRLFNNVSDNFIVTAKTFFETFHDTYIRFATSGNVVTNYIKVTSSKLIINNSYQDPVEFNHGLNIENDLFIRFERIDGKAYVSIMSSGIEYKQEIPYYTLTNAPNYTLLYVEDLSNTTVGTMSIIMRNINKDIWLIGDSYMGMNQNARWCYYLVENKENNNIFISNAPGASSANAYVALQNLLKVCRPKKVLVGTGMNDGSDNDGISSNYDTYMTNIINLLESYGIEIILTTIPTVPNINHEYKNEFVRNSGYRYIDFAKAVGAQSDGTWNTGMLSNDNVHPTVKGAKALYSQAIIDMPELMCDN